jgi:hypothetical protein
MRYFQKLREAEAERIAAEKVAAAEKVRFVTSNISYPTRSAELIKPPFFDGLFHYFDSSYYRIKTPKRRKLPKQRKRSVHYLFRHNFYTTKNQQLFVFISDV